MGPTSPLRLRRAAVAVPCLAAKRGLWWTAACVRARVPCKAPVTQTNLGLHNRLAAACVGVHAEEPLAVVLVGVRVAVVVVAVVVTMGVVDTEVNLAELVLLQAQALAKSGFGVVTCSWGVLSRCSLALPPFHGCSRSCAGCVCTPHNARTCGFPPRLLRYLHDPVGTAQSLTQEGYLRTGDIGVLDARGFLYITGRAKELLVTSGGRQTS